MRFSLIPREMKFFDMFDEAAVALTRAAGKFLEMVTYFDNLSVRGRELKLEEEKCDEIVERIIKALDRSFITPFDREDIHTLAAKIDDILDNMEETAHRLVVFRIGKPTDAAIALARNIHECCEHLAQAIKLCRNLNKPEEIHRHLLEISRLENEADALYREVDADMVD